MASGLDSALNFEIAGLREQLKKQGYSPSEVSIVAERLRQRRPFEIEESATLGSEQKSKNSKHPASLAATVGAPKVEVQESILAGLCSKEKFHGYDGAAQGIPKLVENTLAYLNKEKTFGFNFKLDKSNILFSPAKALVSMAIRATMTKPHEKVLISDPAWVSYGPMVKTYHGVPVTLPLNADTFLPDGEFFSALKKNKDACALIINSPSNPVGNVFPKKVLEEISETYDNPHGTIISDEVYHTLVYDGRHTSMAEFDGIRTVVIDSFSKSHGVPGFRLGYAVSGDTSLIGNMKKINSQNFGGSAVVVQKAMTVAFEEGVLKNIRNKDIPEFRRRRDVICYGLMFLNTLGTGDNVQVPQTNGAFYALPKFFKDGKPLKRKEIDELQAGITSDKYGIFLVEGYHFGSRAESCLRISYGSLDRDQLVELVVRLGNFLLERAGMSRQVKTEEVAKFISECDQGGHKDIIAKYLVKLES